MKYVALNSVNSTRSMPLKNGSLLHIQDAYNDIFKEVMKCVVGSDYDSNKAYILSGCVNSGTGSNFVISAGYIFYGSEVHRVPASSFTAPSGQTAVANFNVTNVNGTNYDPVQFTDGSSINVHYENIITIASGVSGSGISDFANLLKINEHQHLQLALQSGYTTGPTTNGVFATRNTIQQITIEASVTVSGSPNIGSQICALLPTNFRPLHNVRVPCYVSSASTNIIGYAIIDTLGEIQAVINANNFTNNSVIYFNANYYIV
jgi:hypothetical protein